MSDELRLTSDRGTVSHLPHPLNAARPYCEVGGPGIPWSVVRVAASVPLCQRCVVKREKFG